MSDLKSRHAVDRVGVQCIVLREGSILLGLRSNVVGDGTWGLPGGKLERGEAFAEAAARELAEETGLHAISTRVVSVSEGTDDTNFHVQIGVLVEEADGEVEVLEPERCREWRFFPLCHLPENLFVASAQVLRKYREGVFY